MNKELDVKRKLLQEKKLEMWWILNIQTVNYSTIRIQNTAKKRFSGAARRS